MKLALRMSSTLGPFLLVACIATTPELMLADKATQVLAHRGASGDAPETTLAAYRLALEMKVDFLEMDIQMSRDGEIVAIHDALVDRTTDGRGPVREMSLAELKRLDAGSWFNGTYPGKARAEFAEQRIPTLQEIIDLVRETSVGLYIETKNPELYPPELEAKLLEIIRRNNLEKRVVIQSFNSRSLQKVKSLNPAIATALLAGSGLQDPVGAALEVRADELAIDHKILTRDVAETAHARGLTVTVWTVDDIDEMKRMVEIRVDRIITNYPDRLNRLLGR